MKKLLTTIFFFLPYPIAFGWHFLLGATALWLAKGSPADYSFWYVLLGAAIGLAAGALVYLTCQPGKPKGGIVPALALLLLATTATGCTQTPAPSAATPHTEQAEPSQDVYDTTDAEGNDQQVVAQRAW